MSEKLTFSRNDTKILKGIAIIMMIYHHLFAFPERLGADIEYISAFSIKGETISFLLGEFGNLCVMIFIFLSGYGTYISCRNTEKPEKKILKKLLGLYETYWIILAVFFPLCIIAKAPVTLSLEGFLWNATGLFITCNGEWWFFTPFVILQLIYPMIKHFIDRKKSSLTVDFLISAAIGLIYNNGFDLLFSTSLGAKMSESVLFAGFSNTIKLLPGFLIGCIFAKYDILSTVKTAMSKNYLYFPVALLLILAVFYMRHKTGEEYDYIYCVLFIIGCTYLSNLKISKPFNFVLKELGRESTGIWLVHSFYCYTLIQKIVYFPKYAVLIAVWLLIISYLTAKLTGLIHIGIAKSAKLFNKKH